MSTHNRAPEMGELPRPNTYVGAPIERIEDLRFLRGCGCYLDDLSRPGQWHASFVRSPLVLVVVQYFCLCIACFVAVVGAFKMSRDIGPAIPTIPFRRPNPTI